MENSKQKAQPSSLGPQRNVGRSRGTLPREGDNALLGEAPNGNIMNARFDTRQYTIGNATRPVCLQGSYMGRVTEGNLLVEGGKKEQVCVVLVRRWAIKKRSLRCLERKCGTFRLAECALVYIN